MLCGGSDAAIIPIGIFIYLFVCLFFHFLHCFSAKKKIWTMVYYDVSYNCYHDVLSYFHYHCCRLGWLRCMQGTFTKEQWSNKSFTSLGQCNVIIFFIFCVSTTFSHLLYLVAKFCLKYESTSELIIEFSVLLTITLICYFSYIGSIKPVLSILHIFCLILSRGILETSFWHV